MANIYEDLMLDNGEIIRIECPEKYSDDFYEAITNSMKRGDEWSTSMFDGCSASYMGIGIERVNMKRVIGRLT